MKRRQHLSRIILGWPALLFATLALAAVVTASQVAEAVRNSPNATPWMQSNADAIGSLAMFESGGRTDVYNGSCCFGVLQMNRANIAEYAKVSPEVFQTWPLEAQVNAWSKLTADAMNNQIVRGLTAMGTFDGRPVDGAMVLACVQLGIGNCQTMIRSGSCSGFADINGTTICHMADRINGVPSGPASPVEPNPNPDLGSGPSAGGSAPTASYDFNCIRGESGGCLSMSEAMKFGFATGSGVSMDRLRSTIQAIVVALTLLVIGSAMLGVGKLYGKGQILAADMKLAMIRGLIIVGSMFLILSFL